MTLREIAERLNVPLESIHDISLRKGDIAFLLNRVVEERAKYLMLYHRHNYKGVDHFGVKHFFDKALHELDLDKVWPVKEKE